MFNVKTDFGFIGRLFGVPRSWLSRVGAFCSSWVAEGRIIKLVQPDIPDPMNNPIIIGVDEDALGEFVDGRGTEMGEEPVDNTNFSDLDDLSSKALPVSGSVLDWQIGDNGMRLQLFAPVKYDDDAGTHLFFPVNIDISRSGKIVSVQFVRNQGVEVGA